jgi:hypothetical protein
LTTHSFEYWQGVYAAHRIATFPVTADKKPATKGYLRTGIRGSRELAQKPRFRDANAFGFACGARNKITLVDVDSREERFVADALATYGKTPLIARTASGGHHLYYRHNGEGRQIRPVRDVPLDILGGGYAVAPPSQVTKGNYEFIQGALDDLARLPFMRAVEISREILPAPLTSPAISDGQRNTMLWRHCMKEARRCGSFDALLDIARTLNQTACVPPLEEQEVMTIVQSAWDCTERGQNRFGQHGAWFGIDEVMCMMADQDAFFLLAFLRAHQGPWATFMCANGLAEKFGWHRVRFANARRRLIELGYIRPLRQAGRGVPALFEWTE